MNKVVPVEKRQKKAIKEYNNMNRCTVGTRMNMGVRDIYSPKQYKRCKSKETVRKMIEFD